MAYGKYWLATEILINALAINFIEKISRNTSSYARVD